MDQRQHMNILRVLNMHRVTAVVDNARPQNVISSRNLNTGIELRQTHVPHKYLRVYCDTVMLSTRCLIINNRHDSIIRDLKLSDAVVFGFSE